MSLPEKTKAPTVGAVETLKKTQLKQRQYSPRSTATEAQRQRLLALARIESRHTYGLRQHGISHPAGRVMELQKRGYVFDVTRITTVDADSFLHRGVALYTLIREPDEPEGDK